MSKQGTTTSFVGVPTGSELKFHHISSYTAAGLPPPDGGASAYDDADDSTSRPSLKSANSTSLSKSTDSGKSKKVKKKKRRAPVSQGSSSEPTAKATEIQFSVLGNEEVVRMSHLEVVEKQLYELNTREPVTNGPLDRRLGMSDKRSTCATCGQGLTECMGHFGHVRLAMPCFHIGFFKETYRAMTVLCPLCARVKLPVWERAPRAYELQSEELEKNARTAMLKEIAEMARKQRVCPHCRRPSGLVKKYPSLLKMYLDFSHKDFMGLREEFQARFKMPMQFSDVVDKDMTKRAHVDIDAQFVFQLFDALDDRDVYLLGMNPRVSHPRDMIVRMLPVPPVCIRPSVAMGAAGSNEDDLTVKIRDIIFISETLRRRMEVCHDVASIMESWDFLQSQVAMLINADMPGLAQNPNKKQIRSLTQRLKGKAGRFRAHLSGKRVDFSGRTVISPDPNLRIDEVGVPNRVAKSLTFPETVNSFNIARLRAAVRNGPDRYPGANYVMISNGHRLNLRYARSVDLEFGDVVERHLVDGDVVLFNRQPSLHRMSIMAHRVRVMPWRTFRFNECVCNPYNADFDGDEMNLHVPQTQEARAEALLLMSVKRNIVSPRHGEILVCAIQDFITAAYLLSKRDVFYDRARFQQIACMMNDADEPVVLPPPAIVKPVSLWTGKQVLSLLLRPNSDPRWPKIFLDTASRSFNEADLADGEDNVMHARDGWVVVRHSVLLAGVLDKGTLGGSKNGLLYAIMRDYGTDAAAVFLNRLAKLCARWLGERGFSIGIDDVTPSPALLNEKRKLILAGYINCDELIKSFEGDKLPASPGMTAEETLEAKCLSSLSQIRNSAGNICLETLSFNHNAPLIMAVCGSKGSKINISQMVSCVGQQAVGGARIQNGFVDRTLPHFEHLSRKPDAKGFVANSFFSGLNPTEFFFHTMGGREGLVDTAVKTAETGYMQRRLMKSMEDLCTHYDGSVRSSDGRVIQLSFGDDGLDPVCMAGKDGPVDFEAVAVSVLLAERSAKPAPGDMDVDDEEEDDVLLDDLWLQRWTDHKRLRLWKRCCAPAPLGLCYLQPVETQRADLCFDKPSPVELAERVLYCEIEHEVMDASTGGTAEQREARRHVAEWHLTRAVSDRFLDQLVAWINKVTAHVTDSDRSFSYTFPTTRREFITVVSSIFAKYEAARVEAGTAVGAIGAQSIGEPGTQMTLKTFHFAGVASMNVTLGVPRIKEIINATKNISSPIVEAPLLRNIRRKLSKVRATKSRIEETRLRDIADTFTFTVANNLAVLSVKLSTDRIKLLHLEGAVTPYFIAEQLTRMRTKHKFPGYIRARTERMRIDCILDTGALLNAASTDGHCYVEAHREISRMQKFLENVIVAGIPGIRRVVVADTAGDGSPDPDDSEDEEKRDDDDEGDVKMEKAGKEEAPEDAKMEDAEEEEKEPLGGPYKLFVEGNELLSVMGVEGVDGRRCKSNHIVEMYNVLGIEAARQSIIDQIRDTMAGHGLSVDPRHLALLADTMTYTGEILGITRFGISKMKNSVLMLASFEKTADHLFEAAYRGYREPIQGVTESIVLGNPVPLGTGSVHLMHKFADVDEEAQGMPDAQGGE